MSNDETRIILNKEIDLIEKHNQEMEADILKLRAHYLTLKGEINKARNQETIRYLNRLIEQNTQRTAVLNNIKL